MSKPKQQEPSPILDSDIEAIFNSLPVKGQTTWTPQEDAALIRYVGKIAFKKISAAWEKAFGKKRSRNCLRERYHKLQGNGT